MYVQLRTCTSQYTSFLLLLLCRRHLPTMINKKRVSSLTSRARRASGMKKKTFFSAVKLKRKKKESDKNHILLKDEWNASMLVFKLCPIYFKIFYNFVYNTKAYTILLTSYNSNGQVQRKM